MDDTDARPARTKSSSQQRMIRAAIKRPTRRPQDEAFANFYKSFTPTLVAFLDAAEPRPTDPGTAAGGGSVDDRLLRHERRYWKDSAVACGLRPALSESTLWDALAVAMLLGAEDRDNADALLRHLPAIADQSRDRRDTVRTWIISLYPPIDARPWGSLQPDRLAERFVGTRLAATEKLVDPLLTAATPGQVERILGAKRTARCGCLSVYLAVPCGTAGGCCEQEQSACG